MAHDLFILRGNTFHSRLAWQVQCDNGLECDEFDNKDARYLLGMSGGKLLCGARFIDIRKANMGAVWISKIIVR
ncbi:acyl-homoserine-lactone synthase [Klebsiella aerogenes]|uniref:acyl-homoserine-lactone synthase n=1 Tax=Klebsiella aerogenes TaxID=548 RepID=UPI000DA20893|nr:hypothetical protein [Klebsiella aerogenes]HCB2865464.1 hypothetical protein [Klebsiella aerogenes]HCB2881673.1 hypothetical protein [Klebsiella aerogenes]HCB3346421.1 hypothetical protein [Klebsiella aerogenes]HCM1812522.1 hypothetical protein [Klebsiella aerogenes]